MNIKIEYCKKKINYKKINNLIKKIKYINPNYFDIYIQYNNTSKITLENNNIKNFYFKEFNGINCRYIKNKFIYSISSNNIDLDFIKNNIINCNNFLYNKKNKLYIKNNYLYEYNKSFNKNSNINNQYYIYIIKKIHKYIKKYNNNIENIKIDLINSKDKILIINNNKYITDTRPLIILKILIEININKKKSIGFSSIGLRSNIYDIENIIPNKNITYINKCINDSFEMAISNLYAKDAPSGRFPIVLSSGCPGVLLHEAIGHALEADFLNDKTSIFHNKLNEKVTSKICTIVDNGNFKKLNGYINIDDEGNIGKLNILIKNGILKKFMSDIYNSMLMNIEITGNGRRESYKNNIIPRMTNTYLLPGNSNPNEIINTIDYGIYAKNFTDGQVDISSGNFTFSTSLAFLIKNGKISHPLKRITLIGNNIDIMNKISMIGSDFEMDLGSSFCVKDNQYIPVSVGQPTIKIDKITVGGTK
ncbi:protease TldD [endosymbiont of Euscepes postfasciatus]|uniref:metallopeptidase TldD-related protein n=1 Tax=endosymbiont of Euscepes postfasciatus TaxID=650377 RepID=UPI000DC741E6|nr:metallopeptidase TldD-related protein [endosymbiont of Euscepes postfasciatus]BBA84550.1 protease TldD [endosymbiont of Euscepes postfasciatus]